MGQAPAFTEGDRLGAYTIRRRIGVGGMGEVYMAEHLHIGRKAAIKVLLPELSSRPDIVGRFFNEARATGLLRHPGIVEILDCDVHASGRAYIVMEFLEGETLGSCLERIGSFRAAPAAAAAIAGQIAGALAAAHAKGIVHRDLKPDNVFLASAPEGETAIRVKILDFGIAKLFGDGSAEARQTRTGSLLGTPLYMSPEQCRGAGRIDHRTDIYSLGCIIFELMTGRPPFMREGHGELIIAHNSEAPPRLDSLVPSIAPAFAALVARMLAKDVAQRPQAMSEVVRDIEGLLGIPASRFAGQVKLPGGRPPSGEAVAGPPPSAPDTLPAPSPVPRTVVQAGNTKVLPGSNTTLDQAAYAVTAQASPASRTRLKIGVAAGALVLAGMALFALMPVARRPPPTPATEEEAAPAVPERASGTSAPTPTPTQTPTPTPTPKPTPPKTVTVDLEKAPAGLMVELDGQPSEVPIVVPFGPTIHQLRLKAPGFQPEVLQIEGSRDRTIVLNMRATAVKAPPPRAGSRSRQPTPTAARPPRGEPAPRSPAQKKNEGFTDL